MATEIESPEDLSNWLRERSVADVRMLASRAALRVLPLLSEMAPIICEKGPTFAELTSAIFRATSLVWVEAKYPTHADDLSHAVAEAAYAARTTAADALAAAAAADALTYADDIADILTAAADPSVATVSAFTAFLPAAANHAKAQLRQGVRADAMALANGLGPDLLANRPLWLGGIPHSISVHWRKLVQSLPPNEDWDIWTTWYERRLQGRAGPESYEIVFARVPEEEWEKGPAAANAWIKAELAKLERKAVPNVTSVFAFRWNEAHRIALSSGPQNLPVFPYQRNEADHRRRLEAERTLVERLISDIAQKQSNIRPDYLESLRQYASDLPEAPGTGNILLADAEARILRALFESEADFLPQGFAARLKVMLEQHIALRAFYPEVERLYLDVRKGRLEEPLPQDAVEKTTRTIAENTPNFFEPEVMVGLREVEREPPRISLSDEDVAAHASGVILPPPAPIGTLDPKKSRDFMTAATFNKIYEVAESGDKIASGLAGWGDRFSPVERQYWTDYRLAFAANGQLNEVCRGFPSPLAGEGGAKRRMRGSRDWRPLYLDNRTIVGWKRCRAGSGGHRTQRAAMSPVPPPASTVDEL
ncbi:hypothetical protein, partial [Rhodoblastus sp.]|uniref:hypothetical protein n=1 Tax=Rhodoblastus sp. TaxID=1962975 RepID=UPI003F98EB21